ncbi:tyrosine-type recombinase/integrase [Campylobacter fetus]|uniref:tyrosine-type recombinase/integrase n=1 Tax=Campylobacter fetus TaxID=196 RepID=UPI00073AB298|nr:tyrosine-type recombinase/integrase [Campylobacter fetus]ALV64614.1 site-specific recombinase, phage integrase family (DUF4102 domain) [Campylobacter fetus subsp. testudinum Sp3]OCR92558.1 hypothetical protein CFT12S02263_05275 [Campylobacter fetus subsp. testudinum]
MPKISKPLSDKEIKSLKSAEKPYRKSDGRNLFIKVLPSNKKFFELEYKSPTTLKMRRLSLGEYPLISLADARDKANELRKQIKNGIDPLEIKPKDKFIFRDVALEFLDIKQTTNLQREKRRLEIYIFPFIGGMDIREIKATDIIDVLKRIEKMDKMETLSRVFMLLNQIYKSAAHITHNIIADINYRYIFKKQKKQNYPTITDPKEIRLLLQNIRGYKGSIQTKYALILSLYTAMRPFNIRNAKWDEIDFKNSLWVISANKMKMKRDFVLPLASQVINLLKEYRGIVNNNFVFGSNIYKDRGMSENTINTALRRLGYEKNEIVAHGFRAMFSTQAHEHTSEHAQSSLIIERCLAHADANKIRAIYNRAENLNEMRILMQWWADFLDGL